MRHLKYEIDLLKKKLLDLSQLVENSLEKATRALKSKDEKLAREVISFDSKIDEKEVEVEEDCLKIMALHQPVAIDLRFLVSVLKINNDLERIGDLAVNIASRVVYLCNDSNGEAPFDYEAMSDKTIEMLKLALDSLIYYDSQIATKVCILDDEVDEQNSQVYDLVYKQVKEKPEKVEYLMHYLFISRHLERIADYATNIAEDVIYMVDGEISRHYKES